MGQAEGALDRSTASRGEGKPIPAGPEAYTRKELDEESRAWRRQLYIDSYRRLGVKRLEWNAMMEELLVDLVDLFIDGWHREEAQRLREFAVSLHGKGCDDPYVLYTKGAMSQDLRDRQVDAAALLAAALHAMEERGYPAIVRHMAAHRLALLYRRAGKARQAEALAALSTRGCGRKRLT